jgi:hypothetical protein
MIFQYLNLIFDFIFSMWCATLIAMAFFCIFSKKFRESFFKSIFNKE